MESKGGAGFAAGPPAFCSLFGRKGRKFSIRGERASVLKAKQTDAANGSCEKGLHPWNSYKGGTNQKDTYSSWKVCLTKGGNTILREGSGEYKGSNGGWGGVSLLGYKEEKGGKHLK